jgi:hypothetical protein
LSISGHFFLKFLETANPTSTLFRRLPSWTLDSGIPAGMTFKSASETGLV